MNQLSQPIMLHKALTCSCGKLCDGTGETRIDAYYSAVLERQACMDSHPVKNTQPLTLWTPEDLPVVPTTQNGSTLPTHSGGNGQNDLPDAATQRKETGLHRDSATKHDSASACTPGVPIIPTTEHENSVAGATISTGDAGRSILFEDSHAR